MADNDQPTSARAGEVVSNRELMERIGVASAMGTEELRFHINALGKAMSQDGMENQYIREVTGRGYIFTASICRRTPGDGEGNCPLWDGHIIDATFPLL
jgi:DNA-binding winged helix-turn-helix (wHTH) protein